MIHDGDATNKEEAGEGEVDHATPQELLAFPPAEVGPADRINLPRGEVRYGR